jgi:prepilin-type N-terminal cleavage/methylation domain-containing protein
MQTCIPNSPGRSPERHRRQPAGGFSLLEMVIAMFILTIGLLAVAQAISYSLMSSNRGRGVTNAKMLIVSILEQMEALRDTGQLHFNEISNSQVAGSTFKGFPDTFQQVSTVPGADGVFGTADDLIDPVTGLTNTALARPGVYRKIIITTLADNDYLKKIEVTLRYSPNGGEMKELVCYGYLNDNEHGNYIP